MKKLIFSIVLIFYTISQISAQNIHPGDTTGTMVFSAIRPNSQLDDYATAYTNEIRGGLHNYKTFQELSNIKSSRLVEGMFATVDELPEKLFQYKRNSEMPPNAPPTWMEVKFGDKLPEWIFEGVTKAQSWGYDGYHFRGFRTEHSAHIEKEVSMGILYNGENGEPCGVNIVDYDDSGDTRYFDLKEWSSPTATIKMNYPNKIMVTGSYSNDFVGLQYEQDYSQSYIDRSLIDRGYAKNNYQPKKADTTYTDVLNISRDQSPNFGNISNDGTWLNISTASNLALLGNTTNNYIKIQGTSTTISTSNSLNFSHNGNTVAQITGDGIKITDNASSNYTDNRLIDKGYADTHYAKVISRYIVGNGINTFWGISVGTGTQIPAVPIISAYRKSDGKMLSVGEGQDLEITSHSQNQVNLDFATPPAVNDTIRFTIITP